MADRKPSYLLYLASGIVGRAAMLGVLVVLTRFLGTAEYGLFALVVATGEMLDMIASNWVRIRFLREQAGRDEIVPEDLGRMLALTLAGTFAACLVAAVVAVFTAVGDAGTFAVAAIAYIAGFAALRLCLTLMQQQQNHIGFAAVEISRSLLAAGAAVALAWTTGSYAASAIGLAAVTGLCAFAGLIRVLARQRRPRLARSGYREALGFGAPVAAVAALAYALGWYDRFILNAFAGPAAVGVYAAAFAIARQPVVLFLAAMNTYTFPRLTRFNESGGLAGVGEAQSGILTGMAAIGAGVTAGLAALAAPLCAFLFPASIAAAATELVVPIALATLMVNLKQFVFDNSFYVTGRTGRLIAYMVPVAILGIAISVALIWQAGIAGAAAAYLVSAALALAASACLSQGICKMSPGLPQLAGIALAAAVSGLAAHGASLGASAYGPLAMLVAGGLVFVAVYAVSLRLLGIPVAALVSEPWLLCARTMPATAGPAR